jgi:quinol monooxygenase YgiN
VAPTRAEAGNDMYVLRPDSRDAALFVFVEHWKSQQALDQNKQTPHFRALTQAIEGKLARPMTVHVLQPVRAAALR